MIDDTGTACGPAHCFRARCSCARSSPCSRRCCSPRSCRATPRACCGSSTAGRRAHGVSLRPAAEPAPACRHCQHHRRDAQGQQDPPADRSRAAGAAGRCHRCRRRQGHRHRYPVRAHAAARQRGHADRRHQARQGQGRPGRRRRAHRPAQSRTSTSRRSSLRRPAVRPATSISPPSAIGSCGSRHSRLRARAYPKSFAALLAEKFGATPDDVRIGASPGCASPATAPTRFSPSPPRSCWRADDPPPEALRAGPQGQDRDHRRAVSRHRSPPDAADRQRRRAAARRSDPRAHCGRDDRRPPHRAARDRLAGPQAGARWSWPRWHS